MAERMDLRDEDRLPWLETVQPDEEKPGIDWRRVAAAVLVGLGLVALLVWGGTRLFGARGAGGDGALIAAPAGDYKVRPDDPGGLKVEGEGDAAIATSAGARAGTGAVDLRAVPEAPIAGAPRPRPSATPPAGRAAVASVPASGGKLVAAAPMPATRNNIPGAVGGGSLVQLGAFPTEASANAAWGTFAKRFGYLSALGKSVEPAEVAGRKVYRLRVNAGSAGQASDICGRLRVAGEACFVTS